MWLKLNWVNVHCLSDPSATSTSSRCRLSLFILRHLTLFSLSYSRLKIQEKSVMRTVLNDTWTDSDAIWWNQAESSWCPSSYSCFLHDVYRVQTGIILCVLCSIVVREGMEYVIRGLDIRSWHHHDQHTDHLVAPNATGLIFTGTILCSLNILSLLSLCMCVHHPLQQPHCDSSAVQKWITSYTRKTSISLITYLAKKPELKETLSAVFLFFLSALPSSYSFLLCCFCAVSSSFLPLYLVVLLYFHPHDSLLSLPSSLHLIPVFLCFPLSFHFLYSSPLASFPSSPFFFLPSFPPVSSPHFSSFPCFIASKFDSITFQFHFPSPCSCLSEVLYYSFQGQSEGIGMERDTEWGSGKTEEGGKIDGKRGNESWK